ncbi:MAG: carboxypeptidase regulatory-like domain-containing protein, partial [bacterium]|nr:carboxypeptidase regulatory-like domain-containing protein [bacterium]
AQEYRGRIQGTVTDTSQGAVPGAAVTLLNMQTGVSSTRETSAVGHYLFDLVQPGLYSVSVESMGFSKFVQENINLVSRGDVTVDATLQLGEVQETITVSAEATTVQFNTGKLETTVDAVITSRLPQMYRNPLLLAKVDPAVRQNDQAAEQEPYFTWAGNRQEVGGGRNYSSDLQIDGSPIGLGYKTSYMPAPDSVKEVNVQQNAVDAEYGHSSGSAISLTMKSGTNQWHGSAFYQGVYPWANAVENRVRHTVNLERNHMFGGTLGNSIIKNKLFNFFAYEEHKRTRAGTIFSVLPTAAESGGDFSQSLNNAGGLRTIYDPFTTETSADGSVVTRTPFPGNIIPKSQQTPIAVDHLNRLWKPNRPGEGPYHLNNFYAPLPQNYGYHNLSDRVDYNATDKLRIYGRYSKLWTPVTTSNPAGSDLFVSDRGSQRDATSISGDVVYVVSPTTVLNFNGTYHSFIDDARPGSTSTTDTWESMWPGSGWWNQLYLDPLTPVLIPRMSVRQGGNFTDMGPGGGFWQQHPDGDAFSAKIAQQRGKHYIKVGFDTRATRTTSLILNQYPGFGFQEDATSDTYISPDTGVSGDGYATFLLGAIQPTARAPSAWAGHATSMFSSIVPKGMNRFYSAFINDDFKVNRNLTLNLGLRYEYEQAYQDPEDRLTRPLDLTDPIPEMQGAGAPVMPDELGQFYGGPTIFNGAFHFAEPGNRGEWNHSALGGWSPRVGAAYRLNDKTSLRAGWGLYLTPWTATGHNIFDTYYNGYKTITGAPPDVQGVPQMTLDNPFPSTNPLTPLTEKKLGRYTNLGDSLNFVTARERPRGRSNRFNFSVQRQLPMAMVLDVTYYANFTSQNAVRYNVNQTDPNPGLQYQGAVNQSVDNPFFNFGTTDTFPGPLRYQKKVSLQSLMRPYPQYGNLQSNDEIDGGDMKYHSLQIRLDKRFSNGFSIMLGYNFNNQKDQIFYDNVDNYAKNWTWQKTSREQHRMSFAGTWDIPLGKGRRYLTDAHPVVDGIVGGWILSTLTQWNSGAYLRFGGMLADGDPVISNPGPKGWFDTSVFRKLPAWTRRANPMQYDGLTGPGRFHMDLSIVKDFHITERVKFVLRADAFNAPNNMTWANPNMSVTSSLFGQSNNTRNNSYGRRMQLGGRIEF